MAEIPERWIENGFSSEEATKWEELGFVSDEALRWKMIGLTPEQADTARKAGFSVLELKEWLKDGFDFDTATMLKSAGFDLNDAKNYFPRGELEEILKEQYHSDDEKSAKLRKSEILMKAKIFRFFGVSSPKSKSVYMVILPRIFVALLSIFALLFAYIPSVSFVAKTFTTSIEQIFFSMSFVALIILIGWMYSFNARSTGAWFLLLLYAGFYIYIFQAVNEEPFLTQFSFVGIFTIPLIVFVAGVRFETRNDKIGRLSMGLVFLLLVLSLIILSIIYLWKSIPFLFVLSSSIVIFLSLNLGYKIPSNCVDSRTKKHLFVSSTLFLFLVLSTYVSYVTGQIQQMDIEESLNKPSIAGTIIPDSERYIALGRKVVVNSVAPVDDGFVIVGYTFDKQDGDKDFYIAKFSMDFEMLWSKIIGGPKDEIARDIHISEYGELFVVGNTYSYGKGSSDIYIVKLNDRGNVIWDKTHGTAGFENAFAVVETANGDLLIGGYKMEKGSKEGDAYLLLLSPKNGVKLDEKIFGAYKDDGAFTILRNEYDEYIVGGYTFSYEAVNGDMFFAKYDENLQRLWRVHYGTANFDTALAINQVSDGYLAIGHTLYAEEKSNILIVKISDDGKVKFVKELENQEPESSYKLVSVLSDQYEDRYKLLINKNYPDGRKALQITYIDQDGNNIKSREIKTQGHIEAAGIVELQEEIIIVGIKQLQDNSSELYIATIRKNKLM